MKFSKLAIFFIVFTLFFTFLFSTLGDKSSTPTGAAVIQLSTSEKVALASVIENEYELRATYQKVLDKFGDERPFINVIGSKEHNINMLTELMLKHGTKPPADDWINRVNEYDSIEDACKAAVQFEADSSMLYQSVFASTSKDNVLEILLHIEKIIMMNNIPTFERCQQ